jgi:multidrug efflux pump subunit AcrA (membrane-fusion protein)
LSVRVLNRVVETSVKKVQHPTGGVVGEIFVREGEHVNQALFASPADRSAKSELRAAGPGGHYP